MNSSIKIYPKSEQDADHTGKRHRNPVVGYNEYVYFSRSAPAPSSPPQYEITSPKKLILLNEWHCDLKLVECVYYE